MKYQTQVTIVYVPENKDVWYRYEEAKEIILAKLIGDELVWYGECVGGACPIVYLTDKPKPEQQEGV